jgi:hypothetical protein
VARKWEVRNKRAKKINTPRHTYTRPLVCNTYTRHSYAAPSVQHLYAPLLRGPLVRATQFIHLTRKHFPLSSAQVDELIA